MAKYNLIIQTAFVGDLLLTIPLLKRIKKLDPQHETVLLCRQGFGEFFIKNKLVTAVIEIKKSDPQSYVKAKEELNQLNVDKIISPHQSFRTACLVSQLKAQHKIGYKKIWNFFAFKHRVPRPMYFPEVLRQLALIRHLDIEIDTQLKELENRLERSQKKFSDTIYASDWAIPEWADLNLAGSDRTSQRKIFLAPGSEWNTKRWAIEGYANLAKYFIEQKFEVVVVGTSAERHLGEVISKVDSRVKNLCGETDLFGLYEHFKVGQFLISNDSGAMHMAAVAGLPVIGIFGPTVQEFGYRPWTSRGTIIETKLLCRPCGLHGGQKCPLGTHECMKLITTDQVIRAAQTVL